MVHLEFFFLRLKAPWSAAIARNSPGAVPCSAASRSKSFSWFFPLQVLIHLLAVFLNGFDYPPFIIATISTGTVWEVVAIRSTTRGADYIAALHQPSGKRLRIACGTSRHTRFSRNEYKWGSTPVRMPWVSSDLRDIAR